jgi:hypothetical protein
MERIDKVIINYTGWIAVDKNDIKVQHIGGEKDGELVDTKDLTGEEIAQMLSSGEAVLESFGTCHIEAIDGEDDWTYESEVDE